MTPAYTPAPELLLQAQGIRVAIFDVDGVLTDGRLYYGAEGEQLKCFHTLDGLGLKLLQDAGITVAMVSGRDSPALRTRLGALGVTHARLGVAHKLEPAEALLAQLGSTWDATAVMGDDWPDLPLLQRAHFACAPANAHLEVRAAVHHVTQRSGGAGAAREFCDLLLAASGSYRRLLERHLG